MATVDKRYLRTDAAFKSALIELLQEQPISSITVSQIVEKAGYSRNAFYSHFESKDTFILHIVEQEADMILNALSVADPPLTNDLWILEEKKILEDTKLFAHVYNNRILWSMLLNDKLMPRCIDYMLNYIESRFTVSVNRRVGNGKFVLKNPHLAYDAHFHSYLSSAQYFMTILYWEKTDYKYSPNYVAAQKMNAKHGFIFQPD